MQLEPRLRAIVAQEYPRFSDAEFARRHQALARVTIYDDLMHGFGGGYFPPILGSAASTPPR